MNDTATQTKPRFFMTEEQKAEEIGMTVSFLRKDRMRDKPVIPYKKYGRAVRYAVEQ